MPCRRSSALRYWQRHSLYEARSAVARLSAPHQEAAEQTLAYIKGMDFNGFQADIRTQQAVLFNFVILGEASAKVMDKHPDFVALHPEVPWRAIRNMRNRVAHGYFKIDYEVLWETMAAALPALLSQLPVVIAAADQQAGDGAIAGT